MKKVLLSIIMCLCALSGAQAQAIKSGSKWWDGSVLYTATIDEYDCVLMDGIGSHEGGFRFQLSKVVDRQGEYVLSADAPDAILPIRGQLGWRVNFIRQEGMNFLAVRRPNGDVCHTLVLTPDNLQNCLAQERFAENEMATSDVLTGMLLNTTYLSLFGKEQLRLMRNEILARHGYRFQSEDLKAHFAAQPWYHPAANNNSIKLNIIEQTNVQLIKSEEAYRDENPVEVDMLDGAAADGRGNDEEQGEVIQYDDDQYIRVTTAEQFLHSIISGINVLVAKDTEINLTPVLENRDWWEQQGYFFKWRPEGATDMGKAQTIISEEVFDGRQLTICNYKQILIRGEGNSRIVVEPRYAFCLNFKNCEQIEIKNLTIGHTVGGSCQGGVVGVDGGWRISLQNCDLYGCGTYGVQLQNTRDFSMHNSNIHDCTYGIMTLYNVEFAKFDGCDFFRNKEFNLIESRGSEVTFYGCRFYANQGDSPLFDFDREFFLADCEIYHPTESLGTIRLADQSGKPNKFSSNPFETGIKSRNIGPDQK